MKTKPGNKLQMAVLLLMAANLVVGCSSTSSTQAKPLKPTGGVNVDLSKYQIASVVPFEINSKKKIDASIGVKFSDEVATRLQYDFGQVFSEVRKAPSIGKDNELVVTGTIFDYEPGNKAARFFLAVGQSTFKGELVLKDAASNRILYKAPFDKLWAWGGILGLGKGIEDMFAETAAAVANTVAQAKGWKPSSDAPKSK